MDSTAAVWTGARPYDDYSRSLDYYSRGLGPVTGHAAHEVAGAGAVTSAWSTVPPSSLAGAGSGLEERQHEDTVSNTEVCCCLGWLWLSCLIVTRPG